MIDIQTRIVMANLAMGRMLGQTNDALVGAAFESLLAEAELLRVVGVKQLLEPRSTEHMQVVFKGPAGGFIPASVTTSPITGPTGRVQGCILVCRDNLEVQELLNESSRWAAAEIERADRLAAAKSAAEAREQMHLELGHAQKLESIGQLAAGIAHEINTPIQFIGDNVDFVDKALQTLLPIVRWVQNCSDKDGQGADWNEARKLLTSARLDFVLQEIPNAIAQTTSGIEHVSQIVRAMKEFSHPSNKDKLPLDIHHAIENTITVARNEWKYVADLQTDFDRSLPLVPCIPDGFNQAILNVVVNAAHAIAADLDRQPEGKGLIVISTRHRPPYAEVHIKDSGVGIPHKNLARIFDPFFTTKEVGKGTGQGLPITYTVVVKQHGGDIDVQSVEGEGTTIILRFPVNQADHDR